ncbi:MAG: DUF1376 domain-containing protein [Sphingomonadales bacterium]|nr:MAG: DUF1376 domain-containing protein [Sphingomonadales bacterium]
MATNSYVPFYPSDWLAGTRGLSAAETGIYITLIAMMYERGEPLLMDRSRLARLCGLPGGAFKKAIEVLLGDGKIIETDEGLWNEKVAEVLFSVREKRTVASQNAKARWAKKDNKNNKGDNADAVRTQCKTDANQRPKAKEDVSCAISRFDEFWNSYPHRDGVKRNRKGAEAKYRAAVKRGVSEQTIIDGAKRSHQDKRVIEGFARDPTTWFNQQGWTDEISTSQQSSNDDPVQRWKKIAAQ